MTSAGHPQRASSAVGTCHTVDTRRKSGHCHRRPGMGPKQGQHGNDPGRNRKAGELETTPMCWILSSREKTGRGEGPSALTKESTHPYLFLLSTAFIRKAGQGRRRSLAKCSKGETEHSRAAGEKCTSMTFRVSQKTDKFQIQTESHKRHQWLCDVAHC